MSRIMRQHILADPRGRIVNRTVERLSDTGFGTVNLTYLTTMARCPHCRRLIGQAGDLVGRCNWCGRGPLCTACQVNCGVCRRILCGRCRHGFVWGSTPIPACPRCMRSLNRRAMHEQRVLMYRVEAQRQLQIRQQRQREFALRLQALSTGATLARDRGFQRG